jgi:hypothetical protein
MDLSTRRFDRHLTNQRITVAYGVWLLGTVAR